MNDKNHIRLQIESTSPLPISPERLTEAVQAVYRSEDVPAESGLSLVVVGDEEMIRLNETYRGESATTDVLSFAYQDNGVAEGMAGYLGDMIICYEQAERQSEEEGHSVGEELVLLTVHGTLHLLGYDDETPEEKSRMWTRQREIMERLGLGDIAPRE